MNKEEIKQAFLDNIEDNCTINLAIALVEEWEEYKNKINKINWWLNEMLKQARNDETKAIINGTLELLLDDDKEIK